MSMPTVVVIGAGAVGGLYGGLMARQGVPVTFLARSDADHLAHQGLLVDSVRGDFHLEHLAVASRAQDLVPAEVAIVALKTTVNSDLTSILPHAVRPHGIVVMLQNGLGVEEQAAAAAPGRTIVGALAFVCAHKAGPGHIRHVDYGHVTIGLHTTDGSPGGGSAGLDRIAELFAATGLPLRTDPHLHAARWRKLAWNIPFSGLTTVLGTDTRRLTQDHHARNLVCRLMQEVSLGASAVGAPMPREFLDRLLTDTENMVPYAPSMHLDFQAHRPLEIPAIFDRPLEVADAAGQSMPSVRCLRDQLAFLDHRQRTTAIPGS